MPAELLRRRPDIRSAELHAAAQCARIGVAKAELYPSFSLFGIDRARRRAPSAGSAGNLVLAATASFYAVGPAHHLAVLQLRPD